MEDEESRAGRGRFETRARALRDRLSARFRGSPASEQRLPATALREYLLGAATSNRLAADSPQRIDLGEFGREADRLLQRSLTEPGRPEYGSVACVDDSGRLLLLRQPVRGEATSVNLPSFRDKRQVLDIHTHPIDVPFSTQDLIELFYAPRGGRGTAAELVVTPALKLLLLRTARTPFYPFPKEMIDDMEERHPLLRNIASGTHLPTSQQHMFTLTRIAHENQLKLYACPTAANVVSVVV